MKRKVLMTTMGLDIGGAETHLLELCKALKRRGYDVFVMSRGGVYVRELTDCGVRHFAAPLHNKNPLNLIKSYYLLKKIIIDNNIRLVHAHARIPAFLCGLLVKRLRFRFVTSAHFNFDTSFGYKLLTNWGEKTVALSGDLKEYLLDNYKIGENDITVTINGIDTEKFSKDVGFIDVADEFGLDLSKKRIVCTSRMEDYSAASHYLLLDNAESLFNRYNGNIEIVLVGTGGEFEAVKVKADAINDGCGEKFIFVTGPRTDVDKILASATVSVGVSRSALEAMAMEIPVILCGNQGYAGIFRYEMLDRCFETNFCCRDYEKPDRDSLFADLTALLDMNGAERAELGADCRRATLERYSVDRMADDVISAYNGLGKLKSRPDVLISGYYGSNNHGDDALLKAIVDDLRTVDNDIKITVLSSRPSETRKRYGVASFSKFNLPRIYFMLQKTALLVCGGGSLIQDMTSTRSLVYYLHIIKMALKARTRVMLYANGVGPVHLERNRRRAKRVLNKVDLITLRDGESLRTLSELGITEPEIAVTADAAFGLKISDGQKGVKYLETLGLAGKKYFCVAVRKWKLLKDGFENDIAAFCDYINEKYGYSALFVIMQPKLDLEISKKVMSLIKSESFITNGDLDMDELLGIVRGAEFAAAMRLHTVVYAARTGTPVIGLVYDPKVCGMMEMFGQKTYIDIEGFNSRDDRPRSSALQRIQNFAEEVILNKSIISTEFIKISGELAERSFGTAVLAGEILYGKR